MSAKAKSTATAATNAVSNHPRALWRRLFSQGPLLCFPPLRPLINDDFEQGGKQGVIFNQPRFLPPVPFAAGIHPQGLKRGDPPSLFGLNLLNVRNAVAGNVDIVLQGERRGSPIPGDLTIHVRPVPLLNPADYHYSSSSIPPRSWKASFAPAISPISK